MVQPRGETVQIGKFTDPAVFPFTCLISPRQDNGPLHDHDCYELVYVTHGSGTHLIHDRPYPILAGDVYLMRAGEVHSYFEVRRLSIYNLLFRENLFTDAEWRQLTSLEGIAPFLIAPMGQRRHKLSLAPPHDRELRLLCERLHRLVGEHPSGWQLEAKALFIQMLLAINRLALAYHGPADRAEGPSPGPVSEAVRLLHEQYAEPVSMADLAAAAGLSANYLGERFQQEIGMTVQAYLNRLRVDKARELLEHSDRNATQVALDVGFESLSYFGKVFRRCTGHTPSAYRRLVRR